MTPVPRWIQAAVVVALIAVSCASAGPPEQAERAPTSAGPAGQTAPAQPGKVDPREGGFDIGFGEFAVTLEADAIRPGPVTFMIRNGGKLVHGFEMESEEGGDSSGSGGGGGDGFKVETRTFGPGETIRLRLDLAPGLYKIECFVANHDDLGMEIFLEVRPDAPMVHQRPAAGNEVAIRGFAFAPETLTVAVGTEVTWRNADPTEHTVTAEDGSFDSGRVSADGTFSQRFEQTGAVTYFCEIHPSMRGEIRVRG